MSWKKRAARAATSIEDRIDLLKQKISTNLGLDDPLMIQPYIGFGNETLFTIRARVLQKETDHIATADDTLWHNILNTYRFLESDEVPGAVVEATCAGVTQTAVSDDEGYVTFTFEIETPLTEDVHHFPVQFNLIQAHVPLPDPVTAVGRIVIAEKSAQFGIISDIDDTILQSNATQVYQAIKWMFLFNAKTRLPFEGVAHFYQALCRGKNPIFYVSSSPWNLYPMLIDFLENQNIPLGPLFLKDYGISRDQFLTSGHKSHKLDQINLLLSTYPHLPFILIGDSGQKDPEIYQTAVTMHPGRILAIYIRDVSHDRRDAAVLKMAQELKEDHHVEMILVSDSFEAAAHAAQNGWVPPNWKQTNV